RKRSSRENASCRCRAVPSTARIRRTSFRTSTTSISTRNRDRRARDSGPGLSGSSRRSTPTLTGCASTRVICSARPNGRRAGRRPTRPRPGPDLARAKAGAASPPKGAPELTPLQLDFIKASETEEIRQQSTEAQRLREMAEAERQAKEAAEARAAAETELRTT